MDTSARHGASRRSVLAGAAGLLVARATLAQEDTASPLAHGALASNPIAQAFETAPESELTVVAVTGPNGDRGIYDTLKGKAILMPLWAEWCTPCLSEIPDFARLQEKYGNDKFAIVPILTGAQKQVTPEALTTIFADLHASVFEPLIEHKFGRKLMMGMARTSLRGVELPCNLMIAPSGRVVAREFGLKRTDEQDAAAAAATAAHQDQVARAEAGDVLSLWGKPPGEDFARAMASGFLDGM
ncbi:MAG: TlpA family protein disulfide reductase [Rhizomicrobium sp.]